MTSHPSVRELDLARRMQLHPQVALRPEPFGALAYHYGNRRLVFVKTEGLVQVVRSLADHDSVEATFDACGVGPARRRSYAKALASLEAAEVVCVRP